MADRRDVHYSEMGISSFEMLPTLITGTTQDVVDAAYISREHAQKAKYEDNDRTEDSLRHMLLGGLIQLNAEEEETVGRSIASFLIDFREGDAPEDQVDLNNNIYGRRLREMYPDREEFIAKAIEIADVMVKGGEPPELDGVSLQKSYGSFETPERLAEFEKENSEGVYEKGPDGTWQFTEKAKREREAAGLDEGGLMLAPGGAVTKAVKTVLAPTAVALGLSESEEAEAAYIPLKAFAEGSDAAKAFFAKAQKRIDEGADTAPNGEQYDEMGVYMSEDGDLKVDVPELRARDVEATLAMARFQEDMNFFLKSKTKRRKGFEFPITRYIPENSPIFENFPDLKSAKVKILPRSGKNEGSYGAYDPRTQSIEVYAPLGRNITETNPQYTFEIMNSFNTLIHEFQHHIQDVKKAANTGYAPVRSGVGLKGFEQDYKDALDALDQVQPGEVGYEQFKNRVDQMHNLARDSLRNAEKRKEFDDASFEDQLKIVEESIKNFKAKRKDTTDFIESSSFGHGIYIRELGEAEARSSGIKTLLPEGEARKAVGVFYPKATDRVLLTPEDVDFSDELQNTHVLIRQVPSYQMSGYTEKSQLEVTQQPKAPPSKAKQAAGASAVAGLASPPSEAFVAGLGFEDPTPTASLFDVADGAIPNELGITNTFLLDLLVPRTKPYDLVTSVPGLGEGLMAADILSSFKEDKPQDYPEVMADAP